MVQLFGLPAIGSDIVIKVESDQPKVDFGDVAIMDVNCWSWVVPNAFGRHAGRTRFDLLDQVKANWNVGSDSRLPVGTNIEIDYDVWVVQSVDGDNVQLYNSETEETSQHPMEYCLENVMGN